MLWQYQWLNFYFNLAELATNYCKIVCYLFIHSK